MFLCQEIPAQDALFSLKQTLIKQVEQEKYQVAFQTASKIAKINLQNGNTKGCINYQNRANRFLANFDPQLAKLNQAELLADQQELYSQGIYLWAAVMQNYGEICRKCNQNETSIEILEIVQDSLQKFDESLIKVIFLDNERELCNLYFAENRAASLLNQAIYHETYADQHDLYSDILFDLSRLLYQNGEYGHAIDISLLTLIQNPSRINQAILLNRIGNSLLCVSRPNLALHFYNYSLQIRNEVLRRNDAMFPIIYQHLGNSLKVIGDFESSKKQYYAALDLAEKYHNTNYDLLGDVLNNIGNYYLDCLQRDSAEYFYLRGLEMRKNCPLSNEIIHSYYNLSRTHLTWGGLDKAQCYIDTAYRVFKEIYQSSNDLIESSNVEALSDYSIVMDIFGDIQFQLFQKDHLLTRLTKSTEFYNLSFDIYNSLLKRIREELPQITSAITLKTTVNKLIRNQLLIDSLQTEYNPGFVFFLFEHCHNAYMTEILLNKNKEKINPLFFSRSSYHLNSFETQLSKADLDFERLLELVEPELANITYLKSLQKEIESLYNPKAVNYSSFTPCSLDSLQCSLGEDQCLIEFLVDSSNNKTYFITIESNQATYGELPNSFDLLKTAEELLIASKEYDFVKFNSLLQKITLYISPCLPNDPHSINYYHIIPDGFLWNLPFDALDIEPDNSESKHLVEEAFITLGLSATTYYESEVKIPKSSWLGFAPAIFNESYLLNDRCNLSNLNESLTEISKIGEILRKNGYNTLEFTKQNAKISKLVESRNQGFLHIASHYYGITDLVSGLLLTGDTSTDLEILDYHRVLELDFSGDIAFLNTCHSGHYRYFDGEGPVNLNRALIYKGFDAIIYTHRKIPDRFASSFAQQFYAQISNFTPSEALAITKRYMINHEYYYHPLFWSNYQILSKR